MMAGWRQAIELAMSDEETGKLAVIARSGSEAARRVKRAQMLLGYCETSSFFAVGQRLGVHHQTVQRCIERALADGPLAALDDRPRPGKEPTITPEAKAWLVSLACDKAKDRGCWHAMPASTRGRQDTDVSATWSRARCARYSGKKRSSRTRFGTIWNAATPISSKRWRRFCVFIGKCRS
jgi:transposase